MLLILAREPIHSALALILVMMSLAVLYLLLGAEFIAAVQIIVYAGAIMVLFVFVIMLLNAGVEERTDFSKIAKFVGVPLGFFLLLEIAHWLCHSAVGAAIANGAGLVRGRAFPRATLSMALFQQYLFPFEATSILILIAHSGRAGSGEEGRMSVVPISYYLVLSAILFGLGVVAFVFKRNIITIFMSIELMLNAVNLAFVAFARAHNQLDGLVFVFFVIVVAAAEAAVGLAIVITLAQNRQSLNVERVNLLKF